MKKKVIAVIAELIPIICAPVSYMLVVGKYNSAFVRSMIAVTFLLAFLGFAFFFIGRMLAKEDKAVRILGIFDWLATAYVIAFYAVAIFVFAL